jgi:hypothetical protein
VRHDGKLHRLKEARCLVSLRPIQVLAQDQEPEGTGGHVTKLDIKRRIDLLGMLNDGRQKVRVSAPMPMPRPEIETKLAQD